ncbi:unnamed protein product, partial [marine sediment metagenome]
NEYKQKNHKKSERCADNPFSIMGSSNVKWFTGGYGALI